MKKLSLLLTILWLCNAVSNAQISTGELPISWVYSAKTRSSIPIVDLEIPDMSVILSEDEENQRRGNPFIRTAVPLPVCINMGLDGEWIELPSGDRIWRVQIDAIDALSLDLSFDQLWLPQGGKLFIYNPNSHEVIGAITSEYLQGSMSRPADFSTGVIRGNRLVVEYYQPKWLKINPVLSISNVYYGYRDMPYMRTTRGYGDSGACQVNINCAEGANWRDEKRAVARIYVKHSSGSGWCTGALVNNTNGNMSALFLTADHCLLGVFDAASNSNLSQWVFYWDYECSSCICSSNPPVKSTVGATLLANNAISDFALLRLTQDPRNLDGFTPYYLGWDRTEKPSSSGVGIHHPKGDVKKISTYTSSIVSTEYLLSTYNNAASHWKVIWMATVNNHGITEGGSSGSPLLNANHQIVGQLHGGYASCNALNSPDWYGKFSVSWTGGGAADNRRKLQPWLDPQNTNPQSLDGVAAPPPITLYGPTQICDAGGTFSLSNLPAGATVQWSTSNAKALQIASGQGTARCTVVKGTLSPPGSQRVTATVNYLGASTTLSHTVQVGTPAPSIAGPYEGLHVVNEVRPCQTYTCQVHNTQPGVKRYDWWLYGDDFPTGLSTGHYAPFSVSRPGEYTITCKQYQEGCGWSSAARLMVYARGNGCNSWGIKPNPTPGPIDIMLPIEGQVESVRTAKPSTATLRQVHVFTADGRLVLERHFPAGTSQASIDLSPLRPGTYHLLIDGKEHHVVVRE